jgi:FkbM family methyltransferase
MAHDTEAKLRALGQRQQLLPEPHLAYLRELKAGGFEPRVIYDIGACVLHWTNAARALWPEATYVLFDAFTAAEFLYKESGFAYHLGVLSDVDGREVEFYQNDDMPGGNSYYREIGCPIAATLFPPGSGQRRAARTIDALAEERVLPPPDLVKIDTQGSERDILAGAMKTFAGARHMIVEMQHTDYNLGAPKVQETMPFIVDALGWRLVRQIASTPVDADYAFTRPAHA